MSNCGNCKNKVCTCLLIKDGTTSVFGTGAPYEPYQVRPKTPSFRPVGAVAQNNPISIAANVNTVVVMDFDEMPFTNAGNMWDSSSPTKLTAPIDGLYLMGGFCGQVAASASQKLDVWINQTGPLSYLFGAPIVKRTVTTQTGTQVLLNSVITLARLVATDYIELYVRSTRSGLILPSLLTFNGLPRIYAYWMGA